MTIRNRRRNRWRKKLRRCNQCKHWSPAIYKGPEHSRCTFLQHDYAALQKMVDRGAVDGPNGEWWWAASICPNYQAYDRSANQLAQSAQRVQQRMSITEVKHHD